MGVDVALHRGHDATLLDESGAILAGPVKVATAQVAALIRDWRPGVVAIDSPPAWGRSGPSRPIERQLATLGIAIFPTPAEPRGRRIFDWMAEGIRVFEAAREAGYVLYVGQRRTQRHALEVFPHASAVTLNGCLPPRGANRLGSRLGALRGAGVDCSRLTLIDQVDAALAALTGMRFLQRRSCEVGEKGEAVLVLPVESLPGRFRRESIS